MILINEILIILSFVAVYETRKLQYIREVYEIRNIFREKHSFERIKTFCFSSLKKVRY